MRSFSVGCALYLVVQALRLCLNLAVHIMVIIFIVIPFIWIVVPVYFFWLKIFELELVCASDTPNPPPPPPKRILREDVSRRQPTPPVTRPYAHPPKPGHPLQPANLPPAAAPTGWTAFAERYKVMEITGGADTSPPEVGEVTLRQLTAAAISCAAVLSSGAWDPVCAGDAQCAQLLQRGLAVLAYEDCAESPRVGNGRVAVEFTGFVEEDTHIAAVHVMTLASRALPCNFATANAYVSSVRSGEYFTAAALAGNSEFWEGFVGVEPEEGAEVHACARAFNAAYYSSHAYEDIAVVWDATPPTMREFEWDEPYKVVGRDNHGEYTPVSCMFNGHGATVPTNEMLPGCSMHYTNSSSSAKFRLRVDDEPFAAGGGIASAQFAMLPGLLPFDAEPVRSVASVASVASPLPVPS